MDTLFNTPPPWPFGVPLSTFATSGRAFRVRSAVLGCVVIFAADNWDGETGRTAAWADCVVWRAGEMEELMQAPDRLALAHEVKARFGGRLEGG